MKRLAKLRARLVSEKDEDISFQVHCIAVFGVIVIVALLVFLAWNNYF